MIDTKNAVDAADHAIIDKHLDAVLRASGSALRHYSMQTTREDMRAAMRAAILDGATRHEAFEAPLPAQGGISQSAPSSAPILWHHDPSTALKPAGRTPATNAGGLPSLPLKLYSEADIMSHPDAHGYYAADDVCAVLAARTPAANADRLADHVVRETVNQLREIALQYHATGQLRAQIANLIVPLLKVRTPVADAGGQHPATHPYAPKVYTPQFALAVHAALVEVGSDIDLHVAAHMLWTQTDASMDRDTLVQALRSGAANKQAARPAAAGAGGLDASKAIYWFGCLEKCARLLGLDDDEPIPSGVVAAVGRLVAARAAATSAGEVVFRNDGQEPDWEAHGKAEDEATDAARWRETLMHVGGEIRGGRPRFTLGWLQPVPGARIMQGSVAGHFTDAIDAAKDRRAAAQGAGE